MVITSFLVIVGALEANIGAGYVRLHYDKFRCKTCGEKVGTENRNYFGPTKAAISLIFLLENNTTMAKLKSFLYLLIIFLTISSLSYGRRKSQEMVYRNYTANSS